MLRVPAAAFLLLLLAACTSGTQRHAQPGSPTPVAAATRAASGSPSPRAQPTATALRLLVRTDDLHVLVMAVGRDHRARLLRELSAPEGYPQPEAVAAAQGTDPLLCVSWSPGDNDPHRRIACYSHGSTRPAVAVDPRGPGTLALRADGTAIAWTEHIEHPTYPTTNVVVADLATTATHIRRTTSSRDSCPGECFEGCSPGFVTWSGASRLVMSVGCESDDGGDMFVLPLDAASFRKGWRDGATAVSVPDSDRSRYSHFDAVGTSDGRRLLVVERSGSFEDVPPPERAVRVDVMTGRLVEVVSTALRGRYFLSITGGPAGIAYGTTSGFREQGPADPRFYVRLPGEKHGTRVTGLPPYTMDVVAVA